MSISKPGRGGSLTDGGDRAEKILRGAAALFAEKGYSSTSIRDIAESVGMLPGSLYYYVDRKEDLFYGVLARQHEDLLRMLAENVDEQLAPVERVRTFLDNHLVFSLGPVGRSASYQFEFHILDAEQKKYIQGLRRQYEKALVTLIESAQADATVCPDLDAQASARAVLSLLNSLQRWLWNERPTDADTTGIRNQYSDFGMAMLVCDASTHVDGHRSAVGATHE